MAGKINPILQLSRHVSYGIKHYGSHTRMIQSLFIAIPWMITFCYFYNFGGIFRRHNVIIDGGFMTRNLLLCVHKTLVNSIMSLMSASVV
jgi:hypothetical protein